VSARCDVFSETQLPPLADPRKKYERMLRRLQELEGELAKLRKAVQTSEGLEGELRAALEESLKKVDATQAAYSEMNDALEASQTQSALEIKKLQEEVNQTKYRLAASEKYGQAKAKELEAKKEELRIERASGEQARSSLSRIVSQLESAREKFQNIPPP